MYVGSENGSVGDPPAPSPPRRASRAAYGYEYGYEGYGYAYQGLWYAYCATMPSTNKRTGKREIRPGLNRRRRQELRASDGRTTAHKTRHGNSGEDSKLGRVAYIGDHAGLKCFKVVFTDGSTGEFSTVEIRNRLMPE